MMNLNKNQNTVRALVVAAALFGAAQTQASDTSHGLRVVSSQRIDSQQGTRVETRLSRNLSNRVLSAQHLRVALIAADGSVRAEQRRVVGPAQMPRQNARDIYVTSELNAVAAPDDRLTVEWVSAAL